MEKKFPDRKANPDTQPWPHDKVNSPSTDSRDNHGLTKDEALQGKK